MSFLNLAAYRFVELDALDQRRAAIAQAGARLGIKGTVLLASEGINLCVCAPHEAARRWLDELQGDPAFAAMDVKRSESATCAFRRWKVRIKREIITMRRDGVAPQRGRAASIDAQTLRRWLDRGQDDEGRPLKLVDTRNGFEVAAGRFAGAIDLDLRSFSEFPEAIESRRQALAGHRVVTYCTGGIRCEKAALWMDGQRFEHVTQLDGGVLRYFEREGSRHWEGALFVFDERAGLDAQLKPAASAAPD